MGQSARGTAGSGFVASTKNGDWPSYTGDTRGIALLAARSDQRRRTSTISKSPGASRPTVSARRPEYKLEGTPLVVNGVLYTTAGTRRSVVALDAATGELLWVHRYPEGTRGANAPRQLSGRGLAYWTDGRGDDRIIYVTPGYRMIALDAKTGQPVKTFGKDGVVDLKVGVVFGKDQPIDLETGEIGLHSTPTVVKDVVLVGSAMKEGMTVTTHNNTKGLARAFDARTGKLLWTFNTIPRPGEFGNDTWQNNSWAINGNTGVWTQITVDEELGLVYLPVEIADARTIYGGKRPGNNLFGESLVCVDLATGKTKWHFQFVHHPIWDHDMSSAPLIADVTVAGRAAQGRCGAEQAGVALGLRSRHRRADLADRGEAGAEGRRARRVVLADAAASAGRADVRPERGDDPRRSDRLHAGAARAGGEAARALPLCQPASSTRRRSSATSTACSARSTWGQPTAAPTGPAAATIPRRVRSYRPWRRPSSIAAESVRRRRRGSSDLPYQAGVVGQEFRERLAAGTGTYADVPQRGRGGQGRGAAPAGRGTAPAAAPAPAGAAAAGPAPAAAGRGAAGGRGGGGGGEGAGLTCRDCRS